MDDEVVRQVLDAAALERVDLGVTLGAVELVVALEHVALDVERQTLEDALLVLDVQAEREEVLLPLRDVRAVLRDDLVRQRTAEELAEQLLLLRPLENALQPVQEHVHELVRVLLLAHIHGLARR